MSITDSLWQDMAKEQEGKLVENFMKYLNWRERTGKDIPPWDYDPINDSEYTTSYGERLKNNLVGPFTQEWWEKASEQAGSRLGNLVNDHVTDFEKFIKDPIKYLSDAFKQLGNLNGRRHH